MVNIILLLQILKKYTNIKNTNYLCILAHGGAMHNIENSSANIAASQNYMSFGDLKLARSYKVCRDHGHEITAYAGKC